MSAITIRHQTRIILHKGELRACMPKNPTLRKAHGTLGNIYNPRVPESPPESHQNCVDRDLEG
jgi:hypothetical protein